MEKSLEKTSKLFNSRMQARLLLVFCIITLLLVGLMGRLVYIVQVDGDRYAKHVLSRQSYVSSLLPYKRGDILDRDGTILARSELQYRLILEPEVLLQNEELIPTTMAALKDSFNVDNETVQEILRDKPDSLYVIVQKNLKYDAVQKFMKLMEEEKEQTIAGVWFEEEYVRSYPYKTLACDVLGFTAADNTGYFGIEEYYNNQLNGTNGREYGYYDADLNIDRIVKKAVNGNSIVSTIDADVQRIIQEQIKQFNSEIGSKNIGILVMNPNNGEVIAMASNQEYDLNNPRNLEGIYTPEELAGMSEDQKTEALNQLWKNDVISSGFEPGSTFKPVTISAALEEGIVTENDTFYCDGGEEVGGSYIHCSKRAGHGELTLGQSLMFSCNDALMQIAAKEGKDIFHRYQNSFGFGQKTGIDLPGEEPGIIMSLDSLNATELATSSFGQSFNTTMIQMASAFSSLVNGGYYYQPHVVKEIDSDNGTAIKKFDKMLVRQTVSEKTSEFIQQYMYQTVETGTAQGAKVEGYSIGGKTGTAQKLPREAKTYVVSFLGCAPAVNPEIVIYVMVDEPQNVEKQADSSIATKFAGRILNEILPVLGIYPEGQIDYLLPTQAPTEPGTEGALPDAQTNNGQDTQENTQDSAQDSTQENSQENTQENTQDNAQNSTPDQNSEQADNSDQASGTQDTENQAAGDQEGTATQTGDTNTGTIDNTTDDTQNQGDNSTQNTDTQENSSEDDFNPDALD